MLISMVPNFHRRKSSFSKRWARELNEKLYGVFLDLPGLQMSLSTLSAIGVTSSNVSNWFFINSMRIRYFSSSTNLSKFSPSFISDMDKILFLNFDSYFDTDEVYLMPFKSPSSRYGWSAGTDSWPVHFKNQVELLQPSQNSCRWTTIPQQLLLTMTKQK